jgi:membrane-associated protein
MNIINIFVDFFLHIDKNLAMVIGQFGGWSYAIMWVVIFIETGLVIMPFLPGDSLLFAAGALSASLGAFDIKLLWILMVSAAFIGDTVNYWIGHAIGSKAFDPNFQFSIFNFQIKLSKIFKKEYLEKAQAFYDKHGGVAIVLARFVPIVRTFAPFVAGVGKMNYGKFISYNFFGGLAWVTLFLMSGFFFGNIPVVKDNFHYVALGIVLVSVVPIGVEMWKGKRK